MQNVIAEIKAYMKNIEEFDKDSGQDGQALHAYLIELTNVMARANLLMADYQREFRLKKKEAYLSLIASETANQKYFAPSLAKDFVDTQCAEVGYVYDLAERLSRLTVHVSDAVRTMISSLKSEREMNKYGGGG